MTRLTFAVAALACAISPTIVRAQDEPSPEVRVVPMILGLALFALGVRFLNRPRVVVAA